MQKIEPYDLFGIEEALKGCCMGEDVPAGSGDRLMVLTNKSFHLGAASILCPEALEEARAKFCGKDFYILPSSVHEVMLLPEGEGGTAWEVREMVRSVNRTVVAAEEFLSDEIYMYRGAYGKIEMVYPDEP